AARLADEAEGFAAPDGKREVVDGTYVADVAIEDEAALDRKVELQPVELDKRAGAVGRHAVAAARVRSHSSAGTGLKQATLCPGSISRSGGTSSRDCSTS